MKTMMEYFVKGAQDCADQKVWFFDTINWPLKFIDAYTEGYVLMENLLYSLEEHEGDPSKYFEILMGLYDVASDFHILGPNVGGLDDVV